MAVERGADCFVVFGQLSTVICWCLRYMLAASFNCRALSMPSVIIFHNYKIIRRTNGFVYIDNNYFLKSFN